MTAKYLKCKPFRRACVSWSIELCSLSTCYHSGYLGQRVMNDSQRTRLSRHDLVPYQFFPVGKLSLFLSLPLNRRSSLLTGDLGGGGGVFKTIRRRENLVLYKSLNNLCSGVSDQIKLRSSYLPCLSGVSFLSTCYTRRITSVIYNLQPRRSLWKYLIKV